MRLVIGTRGSPLAMWQAKHVASLISDLNPGIRVELTSIKTSGDKILDAPLAQIGGKGLFTKEIEEALLDRKVDLAVHSMKDVPTELPEGLQLAAILKREDPRDVFVSRDGRRLDDLPEGSRIGTSSLRRKAFLLNRFRNLEVVSVRGNLETRLRKIKTENLSGLLLAAAGMIRMGYEKKITSCIDPEFVIPAIGQGALALENRQDDEDIQKLVRGLNHSETAQCVEVERAFLRRMGGGCQVPMAAHCFWDAGELRVLAAVVHPDGTPIVRHSYSGSRAEQEIGTQIANHLIAQGASDILMSVLGEQWKPGEVKFQSF